MTSWIRFHDPGDVTGVLIPVLFGNVWLLLLMCRAIDQATVQMDPDFDDSVSKKTKVFLQALLEKDPKRRLGLFPC